MAAGTSKTLVVDSSVIVKWVNREGEQDMKQADSLLDDWESGRVSLAAPELAKYEVANALLYKKLDMPALRASLTTVYALPIVYVNQTEDAAKEAAAIAKTQNITFYDATFIQAAKELNASLVTANPKHQKSGGMVRVIGLKDYSSLLHPMGVRVSQIC